MSKKPVVSGVQKEVQKAIVPEPKPAPQKKEELKKLLDETSNTNLDMSSINLKKNEVIPADNFQLMNMDDRLSNDLIPQQPVIQIQKFSKSNQLQPEKVLPAVIIEENDNYDPFEGMDHLQKVKGEYQLQNSKLTPFDQAHYIQVLTNPLSGKKANEIEELITVQLFKPTTRKYNHKLDALKIAEEQGLRNSQEYTPRATCLNKNHKLQLTVINQAKKCAFCEVEQKPEQQVLTCKEKTNSKCDFYLCQQCNLKYYIRHSLLRQTHRHHFYEHYELEAISDRDKISLKAQKLLQDSIEKEANALKISDIELQKNASIQNKKKEDSLFKRLEIIKNGTKNIQKFAKVVSEDQDDIKSTHVGFKKFVVIALWRFENDSYRCYRTFIVNRPCFHKIMHSVGSNPQHVEIFLHKTANNELVFFQKVKTNSESNITCSYFDLAKAMSSDESVLARETSLSFAAPVIGDPFVFPQGGIVQSLLEKVILDTTDQQNSTAYLEIKELDKKKFLVVLANYQNLKEKDEEWLPSKTSNLIFINMSKNIIEFVIYDADSILDVKQSSDGKPLEVLYISKSSIKLIEWGSPAHENKQTIQQLSLSTYRFMPQWGSRNFLSQLDEFERVIAEEFSNKTLIQCRLNENKQNVSIIYTNQGLYTFQLKDRILFTQPSNWIGELGDLKDFELSNFQVINNEIIQAQGQDSSKRKYDIKGEFIDSDLVWSGFMQEGQEKKFLTLLIKTSKGVEHISDDCQDKDGQYTITGQVSEDIKTIQFRKEQIDRQKQMFEFKGTFNQDKNQIEGQWQQEERKGNFKLLVDSKQKVKLTITPEGTAEGAIQCSAADFDQDRCELSGSFTTDGKTFVELDDKDASKQFRFVGFECQNRALRILSSTNHADAQFTSVKSKEQKIYAVGNLRFSTTSHNKIRGYSCVDFDLLDLDQENEVTIVKYMKFLSCQVQENFKESTNDSGQAQLPYFSLSQFRVVENGDNLTFKSEMFYQDSQQNTRKLMFLKGNSQRKAANQEANYAVLPQWPPVMQENQLVQYPILAYKSDLPTDNELIICNLITNRPQKRVNLSPFRFIQFMETGLVPERLIDPKCGPEAINTSIFLIVEFKQIFYLMNYRCFPWPVDPTKIDDDVFNKNKIQFEDQIQLFKGFIDPKGYPEAINSNRLTAEKIQSATFLSKSQIDGVSQILVFQLLDEMVCFSLKDPKFIQRPNEKNYMMKVNMQRGPGEQMYFIEENETLTDQLCQLTYVSKKGVKKKEIYRSETASLLAFHVEYNDKAPPQLNDYPHFIYLLNSENKLRRFSITGTQDEQEIAIDLLVKLDNVTNIQKILSNLQKQEWSKVLLHENGFVTLVPSKKNEMQAKFFSTKSSLAANFEFLGFQDDRKFTILQQGRKNFIQRSCSVLSASFVPWMGKSIFEVKEAKNSFFMISNHYGNKRIDIMRVDTEITFKEDYTILGNTQIGIRLKYTNQYMLFNQKSLTFEGTYNYKKELFEGNLYATDLKQLTNVKAGQQFFQTFKKDIKQSVPQDLIRIENDNTYTTIIKNVQDKFQSWLKLYLPMESKLFFADELQWAYCTEWHILGLFVYQYNDNPVPVEDVQMSEFCGGKIQVQVTSFNQKLNELYHGFSAIKESIMSAVGMSAKTQQVDPTYFVLSCDYWKQQETRQHLFTKDYLVIKHGKYLCFAKLTDILKFYGGYNKNHDDQQLKKNFLKHAGSVSFQFELLNLGKLNAYMFRNDCKIIEVSDFNLEIAEKGEVRVNVIQISFSDQAIMWDLDENKEVTFLTKPTNFADQEDFISTGFVPHMLDSKQKRNMNESLFFSFNEDNSLLLMPKTKTQRSKLIRTYAYINLMDVFDILQKQEENLHVNMVDENTMLQNFKGLTFFQLFSDTPDYIEKLTKKIDAENIVEKLQIDESGQEIDNILIRKIYWTLNMPVIMDISNKEGRARLRPNILQKLIFNQDSHHMLDPLLRTTMMSQQEFRLSNLIRNFDCFKQAFDIESQEIQNFLMQSFFENSLTREVNSIKWSPGTQLITFGTQHSQLTKEQIAAYVFEEQKIKRSGFERMKDPHGKSLAQSLKMYPVHVRILEIEWLSECLAEFYMYLNDVDDNQIFGNEFIKVLLEQQNYSRQLFVKVFIPYIVYMVCSLIYFSYYLPQIPVQGGFFGNQGARTQGALRFIIMVGSLGFLSIELKQLFSVGLKYFQDFWNFIYWGACIVSMIVVIYHGCEYKIELNTIIQIASWAIVMHWLMLYYWLRLFPELAFYVTMIIETISDIANFFLMFVMCVAMFANAVYVLNQMGPRQVDGAPNDLIYSDAFGDSFIDSLFYQYLLGLGDFHTDNYTAHPANILIYIYFFLATMFTQIMFLNMLIAIMGETFGRVSEAKERSALMERTHLYGDFMWGITLTKALKGKRYLYVVRPVDPSENEESAIKQVQDKLTELITEKNLQMNDDIEILQKQVQVIIRQHYELKDSVQQQSGKLDKINEMLEKLTGVKK